MKLRNKACFSLDDLNQTAIEFNQKVARAFDFKFYQQLKNMGKKYIYRRPQTILNIIWNLKNELKLSDFIPNVILLHPNTLMEIMGETDYFDAISMDGKKIFDIPFYEIISIPENSFMVFDKRSVKIGEYKVNTENGPFGFATFDSSEDPFKFLNVLSATFPSIFHENSVITAEIWEVSK